MDDLNGARTTLPRALFDADRCRNGVEALRRYRGEYDEKTRALRDSPKRDCFDHDHDKARYFVFVKLEAD